MSLEFLDAQCSSNFLTKKVEPVLFWPYFKSHSLMVEEAETLKQRSGCFWGVLGIPRCGRRGSSMGHREVCSCHTGPQCSWSHREPWGDMTHWSCTSRPNGPSFTSPPQSLDVLPWKGHGLGWGDSEADAIAKGTNPWPSNCSGFGQPSLGPASTRSDGIELVHFDILSFYYKRIFCQEYNWILKLGYFSLCILHI